MLVVKHVRFIDYAANYDADVARLDDQMSVIETNSGDNEHATGAKNLPPAEKPNLPMEFAASAHGEGETENV